jgi:23S rRNA (uracil1939-C5)-methyltransferase
VIADAWRRIGKIDVAPPEVMASPEAGYRLRARLHVRGRRVGFFREGSHDVCDAAATGQLHPEALTALDGLSAGLQDRLWDFDSLIVSENVAGTDRVLHLLPREGHDRPDIQLDVSRLPHVSGVSVAVRGGMAVLGGREAVFDTAADLFGGQSPIDPAVTWTRHAPSFFQANRFLLGALVRKVLDAAAGERCLDLYAGVGLFSVALAARGARVVAVEGDAAGAADLELNARPWGQGLKARHESVEAVLDRRAGASPDVIVVDPPRAGMSAQALDGLVAWRAPQIVYVSCDPPTQARDAARLIAAGYRLQSLDAFDLFPNTPHVETVAVFQWPTS